MWKHTRYNANTPSMESAEEIIHRQRWFHVISWIFTVCAHTHTPPRRTIQPWASWLEVLFWWVDRVWNWTGITPVFHCGFTTFTYNSLFIVLGQQLILCSQVGGCCTLLLYFKISAIGPFCPLVVHKCIASQKTLLFLRRVFVGVYIEKNKKTNKNKKTFGLPPTCSLSIRRFGDRHVWQVTCRLSV